jgi:hypothetical protein
MEKIKRAVEKKNKPSICALYQKSFISSSRKPNSSSFETNHKKLPAAMKSLILQNFVFKEFLLIKTITAREAIINVISSQ